MYFRDFLRLSGTAAPITNRFGYDAYGPLGAVSNGIYWAAYDYVPNSDLLRTTTCSSDATVVLAATRSWNYGSRLRSIDNVVNGTVLTSHTYQYDTLNRRTRATLEDGSRWMYDYKDRNELTGGR